MMLRKITTLSFALILSLGFIAGANAAPKDKGDKKEDTSQAGAVLFRVENIEPVRNNDGLVEKCSFIVTAYNRMNKEIKEAVMQFKWVDNISKKYTVKEGEVVTVKDKKEAQTVVEKEINLTDILPHQQKSFSFDVETDKCFLLLDQLDYQVKSCFSGDEKVVVKDGKKVGNGSCTGNFNYINSKNPEYYSEFKDVPDSVLEKQVEEEKKTEMSKINEVHDSIINDIKSIEETLDKIK